MNWPERERWLADETDFDQLDELRPRTAVAGRPLRAAATGPAPADRRRLSRPAPKPATHRVPSGVAEQAPRAARLSHHRGSSSEAFARGALLAYHRFSRFYADCHAGEVAVAQGPDGFLCQQCVHGPEPENDAARSADNAASRKPTDKGSNDNRTRNVR